MDAFRIRDLMAVGADGPALRQALALMDVQGAAVDPMVPALGMLAAARLERWDDAVRCGRLLPEDADPTLLETYVTVLATVGRWVEMLLLLRRRPDVRQSPVAEASYGTALVKAGFLEEAIGRLQAISGPEQEGATFQLIDVYRTLGDMPAARHMLHLGLSYNPESPYLLFLAGVMGLSGGTVVVARLLSMSMDPALDVEHRYRAAMFLASGIHRPAGRLVASAKRLLLADCPELQKRAEAFAETVELYADTLPNRLVIPDCSAGDAQDNGPVPIMVVGMSRSGKSTLGGLLRSVPGVHLADELPVAFEIMMDLGLIGDGVQVAELTATQVASFRTRMRESLCTLYPNHQRVVFTTPTLSLYLPLWAAAFPECRYLVMNRDREDLAAALALTPFQKVKSEWFFTLDDACMYRMVDAFTRIGQVLEARLGNTRVLTVDFARMHANPGDVKQQVCDFLGVGGELEEAAADVTLPPRCLSSVPPSLAALVADWSVDVDPLTIPARIEGEGLDGAIPLPLPMLLRAEAAMERQSWAEAMDWFHQVLDIRPFDGYSSRAFEGMRACVAVYDTPEAPTAAWQTVLDAWKAYEEFAGIRFGDRGLPYQSHPLIGMPGGRDTTVRLVAYGLSDYARGASILDIGCNTGAIGLGLAKEARSLLGLDVAGPLLDIARIVAQHQGWSHTRFEMADIRTWQPAGTFDLVIAAAVHGWADLPAPDLARLLAALTTPGGYLLLESQGKRDPELIEPGFDSLVATICAIGGFVEVRRGRILDDGINLRAFVVMHLDR